jgi:hypothetical protein
MRFCTVFEMMREKSMRLLGRFDRYLHKKIITRARLTLRLAPRGKRFMRLFCWIQFLMFGRELPSPLLLQVLMR